MSVSIDQVFVKQFEADVHLAYQQMGTKLRSTVRSKSGVVGKSTTFQKIGKGRCPCGGFPKLRHIVALCRLQRLKFREQRRIQLALSVTVFSVQRIGGCWANRIFVKMCGDFLNVAHVSFWIRQCTIIDELEIGFFHADRSRSTLISTIIAYWRMCVKQ